MNHNKYDEFIYSAPRIDVANAWLKKHKKNFQWTDNKVIDFVNWYINLHKLPFRYTLENQTIIDSFKNGDDFSKWHQNESLSELANLDDILPICADYSEGKEMWKINLAGMEKNSPTGDVWGYAPFQKAYKTKAEAEEVRLEIFEAMKRSVTDNY